MGHLSKINIAKEILCRLHRFLDIILFIKILEIQYPILFCFYLGSLILCRNIFVLQTKLWIPPFKWIMPSSMFVARGIKKKTGTFFLWTPCISTTKFRSKGLLQRGKNKIPPWVGKAIWITLIFLWKITLTLSTPPLHGEFSQISFSPPFPYQVIVDLRSCVEYFDCATWGKQR